MANDTLTTVFNLVGELSGEDTLTAGISVPDVMPESDPIFSTSPASEITSADITNWNDKSDFSGSYNDLTDKPAIPTIPTYISAFTNDIGYLTSYTETDPTVPSWAKASAKPSYTVNEIGGKHNDSLGDDINEIYDDINDLNNSLSSKVDKVEGKGLSTNDYTTTEKNKLNSISAGANETTWTQIANTGTKIATISIDGTSTDVFAPEGGGGTITDVQVDGTSVVSSGVASIDLTGKVNKSGDTMTGNLSFSHGNGTVFNYQAGDVSKEVSLKITGAYSDGTGTYPVVGFTDITDNKRVILRNLRNPTSDSEAVTLGYFTANTFSGSYNDLRNKPSIPSKTSDLTNDSGFLTLATLPIYDGSVT